jgi:hypothetical protein
MNQDKQLSLFIVRDEPKEEEPKPEEKKKEPELPYVFYLPVEFRSDQPSRA